MDFKEVRIWPRDEIERVVVSFPVRYWWGGVFRVSFTRAACIIYRPPIWVGNVHLRERASKRSRRVLARKSDFFVDEENDMKQENFISVVEVYWRNENRVSEGCQQGWVARRRGFREVPTVGTTGEGFHSHWIEFSLFESTMSNSNLSMAVLATAVEPALIWHGHPVWVGVRTLLITSTIWY